MHGFLAQSPVDPTSALPGWLVGGSLSGILTWLLIRAEKRCEAETKRVDESEARYREMVQRYSEKTFEATAQLGRATEALQTLVNRGRNG